MYGMFEYRDYDELEYSIILAQWSKLGEFWKLDKFGI